MEDRRAFLRLAVFGLASTTLASGAAVAATSAPAAALPDGALPDGAVPEGALPDARSTAPTESPWWLVAPLQAGSSLGLGWQVARLFPAVQGAVTLNLVHESGRAARIDLSLRDGAPRGPASTEYVDFIVMDGADGDAPMDESLGRVVRRLAAIVAENEERDLDALAVLQPHDERVWRHADALAQASRRLVPG